MHIHNLFLMEDLFLKPQAICGFCFTAWAGFFSNVIFFLLHKRNEKNKLFKRGCEYRISQIHFHIGWSLVLSQNERTYCCRSNKGFPPTSPKKWFTKKSFLFLSKTIKKKKNHVIPSLEFQVELTKFFSGRGFLMFFQQTSRCRALECLVNV